MKKVLLVCFLMFGLFTARASHLAGGEIWYKYIGDSIHPHRYKIYLVFYRDVSGIPLCGSGACTKQLCITSSCFSNLTVNATLVPLNDNVAPMDSIPGSVAGSIITPGLTACVDPNDPNLIFTELYLFSALVDLPGTCADYNFSFSEGSRNYSDNLVGAAGENFYIEAHLNNTLGPNSSPHFLNAATKSFCTGRQIIWAQTGIEPDNDSVYYELETPLGGSCGSSNTPLVFSTGYSRTQPITTANGVNLNHHNGLMTFSPTQQEVDVVNVNALEYRYDSLVNTWVQVGNSSRDVQISIVSTCPNPSSLVSLFDSTTSHTYTQLNCNDSLINLSTTLPFFNYSLSPDGTDFAIIDRHGNLLPILGAEVGSPNNIQSQSLTLHIKKIEHLDTLRLLSRTGNDLNTILADCGYSEKVNDTLLFYVDSCKADYVGIEDGDILHPISLYPNPVQHELTIDFGSHREPGTVKVYDLRGRLIYETVFSGKQLKINTERWVAGLYLINIENKESKENLKFQKI